MFVTGVLFSSGPCLLSCGPAVVCYCAGARTTTRSGIIGYVLFCLARSGVYCLLSLAVFFLGELAARNSLSAVSRYVYPVAGAGLIVLGALMAVQRFKARGAAKEPIRARDATNLFLLGCVYAAVPCAPFWALLSYIGLYSRTWVDTLGYTLAFAAGTFISPLLLAVILSARANALWQDKRRKLQMVMSAASGLVMIILGIDFIRRAF